MKKEKEVTFLARALYLCLKENPDKGQEFFSNLKKTLEKKKGLMLPVLKKTENIYKKEERVEVVLAKNLSQDSKRELEEKVQNILKEKKRN